MGLPIQASRTGVSCALRVSDLRLAPCVEGVVHRRFELDLPAVVIAVDQREAVSDRVESRRLRTDVAVSRDISPVNDLGQSVERRVLQSVLEDDRVEAAAPVDMPKLDPLDVVRSGALPLRDG